MLFSDQGIKWSQNELTWGHWDNEEKNGRQSLTHYKNVILKGILEKSCQLEQDKGNQSVANGKLFGIPKGPQGMSPNL